MRTEEGKDERMGIEGIGMVGLMLVCLPPIQVDFLDELLLFAGLRITDGNVC